MSISDQYLHPAQIKRNQRIAFMMDTMKAVLKDVPEGAMKLDTVYQTRFATILTRGLFDEYVTILENKGLIVVEDGRFSLGIKPDIS